MKNWTVLAVLVVSLATVVRGEGQTQGPGKDHFYNVDRELRVEGVVEAVSFEPRYKDRAPFLIVLIEDTARGDRYSVEVGPSWFFGQDLHKGEKVKIVGSLAGEAGGVKTVIARQMIFRGETVTLRDKKGFPSWSGGSMRQQRKRRIGGF